MSEPLAAVVASLKACRLCAERFAATATAHGPRPVIQISPRAPVCVVGQAPGARVHASGLPFDDRSGDRLRGWMGVDRATFYDPERIATVPMAFCFPGYDAKGSDLPPPPICAETWRKRLFAARPPFALTLLIGGYAQRWALGGRFQGVTQTVRNWRTFAEPEKSFACLPLPHPSWRNNGWLRKNDWFEKEVTPWLRARLAEVLGSSSPGS